LQGTFKNGQRDGHGESKTAEEEYHGAFKGDCYHGLGKLKRADGSAYHGQFVHGEMSGTGQLTDRAAAMKYSGGLKGGLFHGQGVRTVHCKDRTVDIYEGEWRFGKRHGEGQWECGSRKYQGQWRDDKHSGFGCLQKADGSCYTGEFQVRDPTGERPTVESERGCETVESERGCETRPLTRRSQSQSHARGGCTVAGVGVAGRRGQRAR
jgi:hypothetical protein